MYSNNDYINNEDTGPWKVFAIVGYVLGITGLVFCWAFWAGLTLSVPGLVMSVLGLRSTRNHGYAEKGKLLNIVGIALGILFTILWIVLLAAGVIASINAAK